MFASARDLKTWIESLEKATKLSGLQVTFTDDGFLKLFSEKTREVYQFDLREYEDEETFADVIGFPEHDGN